MRVDSKFCETPDLNQTLDLNHTSSTPILINFSNRIHGYCLASTRPFQSYIFIYISPHMPPASSDRKLYILILLCTTALFLQNQLNQLGSLSTTHAVQHMDEQQRADIGVSQALQQPIAVNPCPASPECPSQSPCPTGPIVTPEAALARLV